MARDVSKLQPGLQGLHDVSIPLLRGLALRDFTVLLRARGHTRQDLGDVHPSKSQLRRVQGLVPRARPICPQRPDQA